MTLAGSQAAADDFAALLDASLAASFQGSVVSGRVLFVGDGFVTLDVGLKSEGRVPLREFATGEQQPTISPGDVVDLFVERYEDSDGIVVLSREKARRDETWVALERTSEAGGNVVGSIVGRLKGGFLVNLDGVAAFLPGSQVDIRPVRDVTALVGVPLEFRIVKMDRPRRNVVVSRRAVLEDARAGQRAEVVAALREGAVVEGVVKNLTEYGAFVDLGGIDGLLHVTDIAWHRVSHPSELLQVGQAVQVVVLRFNAETQRVSLGMKQLGADPWQGIESRYPKGARISGRVTNVAEYGVFVEMEPGVEGLVHVSEMSWSKKEVAPARLVSASQEVDVVVLDVDAAKRRISLGMKQAQRNPWEAFSVANKVGTAVVGEVTSVTDFGLSLALSPEIEGLVHASDLSWGATGDRLLRDYAIGARVEAVILAVDVENGRVALGVKQLGADPAGALLGRIAVGDVVGCEVTSLQPNGIEVTIEGVLPGFVRRNELSRDKAEQRPERFSPGQRIQARVQVVDRVARKVALSVRALEVEEDARALSEHGQQESPGSSLGEILAAAIRRRSGQA
jgi:small subunit ribosomal protein S1